MKNRLLILRTLVVLIVSAPFTFAGSLPAVSAQAMRGGLPLPKATQIPEGGVEVEMLRHNRLPMVEIKINGKGPYRMVVDTGAAGVVLRPELAKKLELSAPPGMGAGMQIQVRAPGSDGLPASLYYIDSLTVGEAKMEGVWTIAMELPFGDGMDGVIGMDVFNECLLTYDYPNQRMSFCRGELPAVNQHDVFSYSNPQMSNSHPEIEMSLDGKPTLFMIDTGMRGWFALSEETLAGCQIIQGPRSGEMGMSAAGLIPSEVSRIGNTICLGDFSVNSPVVRNMERNVVGTLFLERFQVTFDAKNKRIRLAGATEKAVTPGSVKSLGMGLKNEGENALVWYVHPDSHASEVGIQVNDVILKINGQPVREVYESADWEAVLQSGNQLAVEYRTGAEAESRTVNLRVFEILPEANDQQVEPANFTALGNQGNWTWSFSRSAVFRVIPSMSVSSSLRK